MLRNKEIRRFVVIYICIAVVGAAIGFKISISTGILLLISTVAFGVAFYLFTKARYRSIAHISEQIDLVLHNAEHLYINDVEEGELSILQSEITKMTLRIREQNEALTKEKGYLADSLADIAHQLRTPLTSANLILSLLEKKTDGSEQKVLLRETEQLFVQMEWLINSLLKISRLDAGIVNFQREPVDVNTLIQHAVHPLLISMELHNILFVKNVPDGMTILGDLNWVAEALQNILKNCMQSVGDNGKIEILCKDTLLFSEITVHDSGSGFEKEDLPHLFERFYRGKNDAAAGYGIGLALCKMILTRQEATITAKNHPKGGALFCIRFPK